MNSTLLRFAALLVALPAAAFNHDRIVTPIANGPFAVACSNLDQDASRIAPGASPSDYWEGRDAHYVDELLTSPQTAITFNPVVPDMRSVFIGHAGDPVAFVAIVCHPTSAANADPDYPLPDGISVIPHMQRAGAAPKLISAGEYASTLGIAVDPAAAAQPAKLPLIVYSHGLGGSPVGKGYIDVMVELAAHGFMVSAVFHADARFSRVRVEDLSDFVYLLRDFDRVVEMEQMRPFALKAMTDTVLAHPGYSPGIDTQRIGGFGASLGGAAMAFLLGASPTTTLGGHCSDPITTDPRIKAAVGYVPFAGYSFLPAFCNNQTGAAGVNRPYLAMSGTADTTAPLNMMQLALNQFGSSRYLVQLADGKHELRPEDVDDLFTWMITFFDAYLDIQTDRTAMARLIKMNGVVGGRDDSLVVDAHVPFANAPGEIAVREFYNPLTNHFHVTADQAEIDAILTGAAGSAWQYTAEGFKAYAQMPPDAFMATAPVCRFRLAYRNPIGSSFYTASGSECETVKASHGWGYIGTPFFIQTAAFLGGCPDGYLGVHRVYNNGYVRNDSNHRYTTSDSSVRDLQRQGWIYESTVMCSRP